MARDCRRKVQPCKSKSLAETSPHFFKVILPSTLEEKKLGIPERFAKMFGDELSSVAMLTIPDGHVWPVGLTREGSKFWFQDGWNDFVQNNSICAGYFLVFKYAKKPIFQVLIFDMTACEIHYPYNAPAQISALQDGIQNKPESKKSKIEDMPQKGDEFLHLFEESGIYITGKHKLLSKEEKEKAINIARFFKPKHPAFMVFLRAPKIIHPTVPAKFVNKYYRENAKFIKLQSSDGREWLLNNTGIYRGQLRLGNGWARFSNEMNLKAGDICVFELMREKDFVLKASIFKI
ncbi:B3 domain-containing transcription factor VRN1-like [Pistacia vera]|uniref:B3 domain-containing transcription factor VRN1-like n=1 Tax=Pistacia vera TaxID=55513 RepID=UPI001263D652|nr:B3 domain-containing transcription factor VRN1-like [Pistacia vera]